MPRVPRLLPCVIAGLGIFGQTMEGSFSRFSTSVRALAHCRVRPEPLVHGVGSLALFITAPMWKRMSSPDGKFCSMLWGEPSIRRGQKGSFQESCFGKNSLVAWRILRPGHAGFWVPSDRRFISSALGGNRRMVVLGLGPLFPLEVLSRWLTALMEVSPSLLAAHSVGKMIRSPLEK